MLIEFNVANYKSFKDKATFSMFKSRTKELEENTFTTGRENLLKSAVIYGHNGSGKSNLLNAMDTMKDFIHSSNLSKLEDNKSYFEILFNQNGTTYRYGFEADCHRIYSEWLFKNSSKRESKLFIIEDNIVRFGRSFKIKKLEMLDNKLLLYYLLHTVNGINGEHIYNIYNWFNKFHINTKHWCYANFTYNNNKVIKLMNSFGVDVSDIVYNCGEAMFGYMKNNRSFFIPYTYEATGVKKIFNLSIQIVNVLENGGILIYDDLDANLHPAVIERILGVFNSLSNKNSQLIFTSNNTSSLSNKYLRRDQIWFTEMKNDRNAELFSLAEFKLNDLKIRKDASYEKWYLQGRFGAMPFTYDCYMYGGI